MAKDLRSFLEKVQTEMPHQFIRIRKEIELEYETTAIARKLQDKGKYPILFYENVKERQIPIVSNLYATRSLLALAIDTVPGQLTLEYRRRQSSPLPPKLVSSGSVKEMVLRGKEVDLGKLPVTLHHESDGAPYITGGIFIAKDPDTGVRNCSFGRLMVVAQDKLRTHIRPGGHLDAIYRKYERENMPMPCSIFIGHHPALGLGSLSLIPFDMDELDIMGGMLGEPIEMVKGEIVDCAYPAHAEMVLEAEVPPRERQEEGPFTEFTGYAAGVRKRQVVNIKALCMRKDAIYHDLIAGTDEHLLPGAVAREAHLYKVANSSFPVVRAICVPLSGTGRFHCYVSINKEMEGQAKAIGMAIFGADMFVKLIVVVDKDIDVYNEPEVLWAIATRVQADRDISIISNCRGSDLDPSTHYPPEQEGITAKVIIDATAKPSLDYEVFSRRARLPSEVEKRVRLEDYIPNEAID